MPTQLRVLPLINSFKQQQLTSIVVILYTSFALNNNCSLNLYTTILKPQLFSFYMQRVFIQAWLNSFWFWVSSSHTTDWIPTEPKLPALCCLLYHKGQESDEWHKHCQIRNGRWFKLKTINRPPVRILLHRISIIWLHSCY